MLWTASYLALAYVGTVYNEFFLSNLSKILPPMGHLTNAMCDKCRPVEQLKQSTLASSRVNGMVISMS